MFEDDRIKALLEAMKLGGPGGALIGGMGRVTGRPGMATGSIRGGFGNRSPGRGSLGFSPFAAQTAMGKANLHAPSQVAMQGNGNSFYGLSQRQEQSKGATPGILPGVGGGPSTYDFQIDSGPRNDYFTQDGDSVEGNVEDIWNWNKPAQSNDGWDDLLMRHLRSRGIW